MFPETGLLKQLDADRVRNFYHGLVDGARNYCSGLEKRLGELPSYAEEKIVRGIRKIPPVAETGLGSYILLGSSLNMIKTLCDTSRGAYSPDSLIAAGFMSGVGYVIAFLLMIHGLSRTT